MSNEGNLWSMAIPLLIFDGNCLTCTTQGMRCEIKVGKYKQHSGITYCKLQKDKKKTVTTTLRQIFHWEFTFYSLSPSPAHKISLRSSSAIVGFKAVFKETVVGE